VTEDNENKEDQGNNSPESKALPVVASDAPAGQESDASDCESIPTVKSPERRDFMLQLGIGLNVVAATLFTIPIVGFLFSAVRRKAENKWVTLGAVKDFPENETRKGEYINPYTVPWDGSTANTPCWVRRLQGEKFQVFAINCTHLGCPVRWFKESKLYMCPCHGGVFYEDGAAASGPPPAPLFEYDYQIKDGNLQIRAGHLPTHHRPT
jgi:menaquinol-cytochrome c reductase iron-sulfur subunit